MLSLTVRPLRTPKSNAQAGKTFAAGKPVFARDKERGPSTVFDLKRLGARGSKWSRVNLNGRISMAQKIVTSLLYDGAIRVPAIDTLGRRKGRIIEVEVVATRERLHGSAQRLQRLVNTLHGSCGEELDQVPVWTRGKTS